MNAKFSISQRDSVIDRYNKPAIFLHWAIFMLVLVAYVAINVRGPEDSASREFWTSIHSWAGLLVLSLALVRAGWRLTHTPPPNEPDFAVLIWLAKATHIALYTFIIVQPLLGILTLNLGGDPVNLIGLDWSFRVVGPNDALASIVEDVHEVLGNVFYYVIGLHALAALWHHYILHDNTLRKMI